METNNTAFQITNVHGITIGCGCKPVLLGSRAGLGSISGTERSAIKGGRGEGGVVFLGSSGLGTSAAALHVVYL